MNKRKSIVDGNCIAKGECYFKRIAFLLSGTIGDGVVVFPMSLAMHFYGAENKPSFIPNFAFYFVVTLIAGFFILCNKERVGCYRIPFFFLLFLTLLPMHLRLFAQILMNVTNHKNK